MGYGYDARFVFWLRHSSFHFNVTLTVIDTGFVTLTVIEILKKYNSGDQTLKFWLPPSQPKDIAWRRLAQYK